MPKTKHYQTRSQSKSDKPSTSEPLDTEDRSRAKTPERADPTSKTPEPEPERPESPQNCSICLSGVENKSFTDSCLHTFCYVCLLEWSKVKAVCPLCKQPFKKIIYNVRSLDDFDEYPLPPPQPRRDHLWENSNANHHGMRFRYRTTMTNDRPSMLSRRRHPAGQFERSLGAPMSRPVSREEVRQRRERQILQHRRRIYQYDMWVQPVSPTRYRETSPAFFAENEACRYALIPWLSRELNILLNGHEDNVHYVLELILDIVQRFEIRSDEFYELVHNLIGRHTRHFIHEFYHFARSPYDLNTYDQRATYQNRRELPVEEDTSDDDDDDDDVMVVGEDNETLSDILSRSAGVPLDHIGPINVEWNIPNTLNDVRDFLQLAMGSAMGFGNISSGAAQMARINSHHNYADTQRDRSGASSAIRDLVEAAADSERPVNVDESDDDVIFVRYEKPYAERSPIVLSSGSDHERAAAEEEDRSKKRRRSDSSRSRHRHHERSKSRRERSRSKDRHNGDTYRTRRSDDRRSRDRRSRSSECRSRSRNEVRHTSRSMSQESKSSVHDRNSNRTERRRSRSRERASRHRRHIGRRSRDSSSDSVEITRIRRKKAKKHKRNKKHKKTRKRRRLSSEVDQGEGDLVEPGTSGESRRYKKHPTGHKTSKRKHANGSGKVLSSVVVVVPPRGAATAAAETVVSSGFEDGDVSGSSPIDVTGNVVGRDVAREAGESRRALIVEETLAVDVVRSIQDELISSAFACACKATRTEPGAHSDVVASFALLDQSPSLPAITDSYQGENSIKSKDVPGPEKLPSIFDEFMERNGLSRQDHRAVTPALSKSPGQLSKSPGQLDYDSDCIMHADDDVVFEGECRCRARQKCAKCLHSSESSTEDDSSESESVTVPVRSSDSVTVPVRSSESVTVPVRSSDSSDNQDRDNGDQVRTLPKITSFMPQNGNNCMPELANCSTSIFNHGSSVRLGKETSAVRHDTVSEDSRTSSTIDVENSDDDIETVTESEIGNRSAIPCVVGTEFQTVIERDGVSGNNRKRDSDSGSFIDLEKIEMDCSGHDHVLSSLSVSPQIYSNLENIRSTFSSGEEIDVVTLPSAEINQGKIRFNHRTGSVLPQTLESTSTPSSPRYNIDLPNILDSPSLGAALGIETETETETETSASLVL